MANPYVGAGFDEFIDTKQLPGQEQIQFTNKATGGAFDTPTQLAQFANTSTYRTDITGDNVFDVLRAGLQPLGDFQSIKNGIPVSTISQPALNLPSTPQPDSGASFINSLTAPEREALNFSQGLSGATQSQAQKDALAKEKQLEQQFTDASTQLEGKSTALLNEEEKLGLPGSEKELGELNRIISERIGAYDLKINGLENQAIPIEFITGQQAAMQRQKAIEIGALSTRQAALQGNIALARDRAQRTVDLQFAPIEQRIKNTLAFLDLNERTLSREEKKQAENIRAVTEARAAKLQEQKESRLWFLENGIQGQFSTRGGTVYRVSDGYAFSTPEEAASAGVKFDADGVAVNAPQAESMQERAYQLQRDQFAFNQTESNRNFDLNSKEFEFSMAERNRQYGLDVQRLDIDRMQSEAAKNPEKLLSPDEALKFGLPYGATTSDALGLYVQKPPTEAQSKDAGYAQRVADANSVIATNQESIAKYNSAGYWAANKLPNALKPALIQSQDQAARNFINSILRRESGAAISPSEFDNARQQYLPQPGDKKETLEQKARNRQVQLDNLKKSAGSAWQKSLGELEEELLNSPKGKARLGELSQKYESGGNPGAIGKDSTGGWSYGTYQLAHNNVNRFLESTPQFGKLFKGLVKGTPAFNNKWQEVARTSKDSFEKAQHDFIAKTHYEPQVSKLSKIGIDVNKYSSVLKDVIWSTAVQHGAGTNVVASAISKVGKNAPEASIIKAIYDARWGGGSQFASSTQAVKNAVKNRFFGKNGELATALNKLKTIA